MQMQTIQLPHLLSGQAATYHYYLQFRDQLSNNKICIKLFDFMKFVCLIFMFSQIKLRLLIEVRRW